jgi:protein-tyrosine phosphatase
MVHCLAGVSRSVCLVLAFFIKCKGFSYEEAYNLVKIKRSIVIISLNVDPSQLGIYCSIEKIRKVGEIKCQPIKILNSFFSN